MRFSTVIWVICFRILMAAESPPCGYTHPCHLRSVPQHFGHPHRKFSSHHLLLVFLKLVKYIGRFGDDTCNWGIEKNRQVTCTVLTHQTYYQIVLAWLSPFTDLERLSTLEGCTHPLGLEFHCCLTRRGGSEMWEFQEHRLDHLHPSLRVNNPIIS